MYSEINTNLFVIYFAKSLSVKQLCFNFLDKAIIDRTKCLFSVPLVNISVVEGRPVELPCDITPPGEDELHMVFWFKDEAGVPLYT